MHAVTTHLEHDLPGNRETPDAACYGGYDVAGIVPERKRMSTGQLTAVPTKPQMFPTQIA